MSDDTTTDIANASGHAWDKIGNPADYLRREIRGEVDWTADVRAFHEKFGCHIGHNATLPDDDTLDLRYKLIHEESRELLAALDVSEPVQIAKESIDLIYVVLGTLISCGIDPNPIWTAVHASNMNKSGDKRGDGKVLKNPDWKAPDIVGLIQKQRDAAKVRL